MKASNKKNTEFLQGGCLQGCCPYRRTVGVGLGSVDAAVQCILSRCTEWPGKAARASQASALIRVFGQSMESRSGIAKCYLIGDSIAKLCRRPHCPESPTSVQFRDDGLRPKQPAASSPGAEIAGQACQCHFALPRLEIDELGPTKHDAPFARISRAYSSILHRHADFVPGSPGVRHSGRWTTAWHLMQGRAARTRPRSAIAIRLQLRNRYGSEGPSKIQPRPGSLAGLRHRHTRSRRLDHHVTWELTSFLLPVGAAQ